MAELPPDDGAFEVIVVPRTHELADNFEVRRALPSRQRRMVGPFVFLDQMGPHLFTTGSGLDVLPHPHIGLATVTYLYAGEMLHRDSVGSVQLIRPGDVNWMTAGRGIVHSERSSPQSRKQNTSLFGIQCWVALPQEHEERDPDFLHIPKQELPVLEGDGALARIIAGSFHGRTSPTPTLSDLCQVDVLLEPSATLNFPAEYPEQALYIAEGSVDFGADGKFDAGQLLVLRPGCSITATAVGPETARIMLVGGEPTDGPRYISWNFVSSSAERIEQAKEDWRRQRFPIVPDEHEFIPLPEIPGKPARYP